MGVRSPRVLNAKLKATTVVFEMENYIKTHFQWRENKQHRVKLLILESDSVD